MSGGIERFAWLRGLKPGDEAMFRGVRCTIVEIGPRGNGGGRGVVHFNYVQLPDGSKARAFTQELQPVPSPSNPQETK